jgi:hypothetical protein
MSSVARR